MSNGMTRFETVLKGLEDSGDTNKIGKMARLCETAERFEEMCDAMDALVKAKSKADEDLSLEERNMLSVAYKNAVGKRRSAWRQITSLSDNETNTDLRDEYKSQIEAELEEKCERIVKLTKDHLSKTVPESEERKEVIEVQVFYSKMCGDYYRYECEITQGEKLMKTKENAKKEYEAALKLSNNKLEPTHPTHLGLALNASVFYYEILEQKQEACTLAKNAFDNAIQKLDSLSDATYKDSTLIMQLLRDNLTLWNNSEEEAQDNEA